MSRTPLARTPFARRVPGCGPLSARVVFLGEAPGKDEARDGEPFVGASGRFLWHGEDWSGSTKFPGLDALGLPKAAVRVENVIEQRPLDNSLLHVQPRSALRWQADFWARAEKWTSANLIVPLGNLALNTLRRTPLPVNPKTGKWRTKRVNGELQIDWRDKITNWRGSIFSVRMPNGARCKVIPTFHPAYVLRAGNFFDVWLGDLTRIVGDAAFPELRRWPDPEILIDPTLGDALDFVEDVKRAWARDRLDAILACDIETVARSYVDLVGFSLDPKFSIVINTLRCSWAWRIVAALLALPIPKGWHYGIFDTYVLRRLKGLTIRRPLYWDSQLAHHCLDPRDQHRLAYCASRDLRVRFWKHERDKEDETSLRVKDPRKRKRYNGKDVSYTRGLIGVYRDRLADLDLLDVYREDFRELGAACLDLSLTGFRVDNAARREMFQRETAILDALRTRMAAAAGTDLLSSTGKGFSNPKVTAYFYDTLKCRPFRKRGTGTRTCDELAIRKLMRKYAKARPVGTMILDYRKHAKIKQELRAAVVDDDGRMRSRFSPTAKTARLRAAKTPMGTGVNLQNRDRHSDLRRMFVPDRGHVLLSLDEGQAEDRMVDGKSGDPDLLRHVGSTAIDRHVMNASRIYDLPYDALLAAYKAGDPEANEKRQMGKRVRHACVTGDHEVLTYQGWVPIADVARDVAIAVWDGGSSAITFECPSHWTTYEAQSLLRWDGPAFSQVVTLDHRMPYRTNGKLKVDDAWGMISRLNVRLPITGFYDGPSACRLAFAQFVAAVQADGYYTGRQIVFHLKKTRKVRRLRELCKTLSLTVRVAKGYRGARKFYLRGAAVDEARALLGPSKSFGPFLLHWPLGALRAFLDEVSLWDGTRHNTFRHRRIEYFSKNLDNVRWVQTVAHLTGRQSKVTHKTAVWVASINTRQHARRPIPFLEVPATGRHVARHVYCPTVSTGFFLVRHNGRISITGNCNYGMRGHRMAEVALLESEGTLLLDADECEEWIERLLTAMPGITHYHDWVSEQLIERGYLEDSFGWRVWFRGLRLSHDDHKEAFAWAASTEVAKLMNRFGFRFARRAIRRGEWPGAKIVNQGHDSVDLTVPPSIAWHVASALYDSLHRERTYPGAGGPWTLRMPVGVKVGRNWKHGIEFKVLPERAAFEAAVKEMQT